MQWRREFKSNLFYTVYLTPQNTNNIFAFLHILLFYALDKEIGAGHILYESCNLDKLKTCTWQGELTCKVIGNKFWGSVSEKSWDVPIAVFGDETLQ